MCLIIYDFNCVTVQYREVATYPTKDRRGRCTKKQRRVVFSHICTYHRIQITECLGDLYAPPLPAIRISMRKTKNDRREIHHRDNI